MEKTPGKEKGVHIYKPHPEVGYITEAAWITLIHTGKGKTLTLHYPEAAIWDLACRDYPQEKVITLLSMIAYITESHAESLVKAAFRKWLAEGFVLEEEDHG